MLKVLEACWQYRKPFHLVSTHRSISNFYITVMTLPQTTWRVKRTSRKCWLIPAAHIHWPLSLCTSDGQTNDRDFLSIPVACDFLKNVVFPASQLDFDIKTESVQDLIKTCFQKNRIPIGHSFIMYGNKIAWNQLFPRYKLKTIKLSAIHCASIICSDVNTKADFRVFNDFKLLFLSLTQFIEIIEIHSFTS